MKYPRYVLTGPPGSGKTSVLNALETEFCAISEPARRVLAAERAKGGRGTGDQDPHLFVALMHQMAIADHTSCEGVRGPVLFDRGMPDLMAFATYYGLQTAEFSRSITDCRYSTSVFWFPAWEAIYKNDDERTLDFEGAQAFGELIRAAYLAAGYELIEIPRAPVLERAAFVRGIICAG